MRRVSRAGKAVRRRHCVIGRVRLQRNIGRLTLTATGARRRHYFPSTATNPTTPALTLSIRTAASFDRPKYRTSLMETDQSQLLVWPSLEVCLVQNLDCRVRPGLLGAKRLFFPSTRSFPGLPGTMTPKRCFVNSISHAALVCFIYSGCA